MKQRGIIQLDTKVTGVQALGPADGREEEKTGLGRCATLTIERGPEDPNILWLFGTSWLTQGTGTVGKHT